MEQAQHSPQDIYETFTVIYQLGKYLDFKDFKARVDSVIYSHPQYIPGSTYQYNIIHNKILRGVRAQHQICFHRLIDVYECLDHLNVTNIVIKRLLGFHESTPPTEPTDTYDKEAYRKYKEAKQSKEKEKTNPCLACLEQDHHDDRSIFCPLLHKSDGSPSLIPTKELKTYCVMCDEWLGLNLLHHEHLCPLRIEMQHLYKNGVLKPLGVFKTLFEDPTSIFYP